jgi:hypothetical protein
LVCVRRAPDRSQFGFYLFIKARAAPASTIAGNQIVIGRERSLEKLLHLQYAAPEGYALRARAGILYAT